MIASERRRFILAALSHRGVISLKDVTRELGVAEITVRRDLEKLEGEGKLKRVQGGAMSPEDEPEGAELTMAKKMPENMREKQQLAQYAAGLVSPGDCVFIDGGTTMLPLAVLLCARAVTIVTYSTMLLPRVAKPTAKIILIGGEYLPHYNMNLGSMAQDMLRQFHFDRAFFGCAGIDADQQVVYTTEHESMAMKRIAMENTAESHLLVDSSKFRKHGFLKLCGTAGFTSIITDDIPDGVAAPENVINLKNEAQ